MNIASSYSTTTTYIRLVDGTSGFSRQSDGTYTLGKDATLSNYSFGGAKITMSGGTMTVTTNTTGTYANSSSFSDKITYNKVESTNYTEIKYGQLTSVKTKTEIDPAKYVLDVSAYKGKTSSDEVENFIRSLAGITDNYFYFAGRGYYEFIDKGSNEAVAAVNKIKNGTSVTNIDLNDMRKMVKSGQEDIASAFSQTVRNAVGTTGNAYAGLYEDSEGDTVGVYLANKNLTSLASIFRDYDATLGYYELDFSSVDTSNIADLDDKGFRFYCATDDLQWYNFLYDDGKEDLPDRPASGTATLDIHTATVDISQVNSVASLVDAVYRDGDAMMAEQKHYYRLSKKAGDDTKLYVYDPRRFNISMEAAYRGRYNDRGAKIADGVMDNVIKSRRDIMQKKIVIQDTDKADFHTRLYIDQTTLDHLFEYRVGNDDIFNYRISDAKTREKLLGNDETGEKGMLDTAINHLLEAQTLLGAQAMRLEATSTNLTVSAENEQASESVIRDADMAKATVEFAKSSILTRSSQAMLAQANNDTGSVLSLLQ